MSYKVLSEIIKQKDWAWNYDGVFLAPNIPSKKLSGAIGSYANDVAPGDVIILLDDTVFGGAKEGVLVTNNAIYAKELLNSPKKVEFKNGLKIEPGEKKRIMVDGDVFFTASVIEHLTLLTVISRVSLLLKEIEETMIKTSTSGTSSEGKVDNHIKSFYTLKKANAANSIFHSSKKKYISMLRAEKVPDDVIKLTSFLYDISLSISSPEENQELSWFLFNDDTIFQALTYTYYTAARLLLEHIGEEHTLNLLLPLFYAVYFYFSESTSNTASTLKSAINPMADYMESEIAANFKENVKWYLDCFNNGENGVELARDYFMHQLLSYYDDNYGEDEIEFLFDSEFSNELKKYINPALIRIEHLVETVLIKFFDGKL